MQRINCKLAILSDKDKLHMQRIKRKLAFSCICNVSMANSLYSLWKTLYFKSLKISCM